MHTSPEKYIKYVNNLNSILLGIGHIIPSRISKTCALIPTYLLSPTIKMGWWALNATWFSRALFRETICWEHIGWYLSSLISNTCALPSTVTAANTVLENGAQATSPTCEFKSNMKIGFLKFIMLSFWTGKWLYQILN